MLCPLSPPSLASRHSFFLAEPNRRVKHPQKLAPPPRPPRPGTQSRTEDRPGAFGERPVQCGFWKASYSAFQMFREAFHLFIFLICREITGEMPAK